MKQNTKNTLVSEMVKFWNENAEKAYDYPSLDIYYEDGSYLKFFIQPKQYQDMPLVGCVVAYEDEDRSVETGCFIPPLNKIKLETYLVRVLGQLRNSDIDIDKQVMEVFENV